MPFKILIIGALCEKIGEPPLAHGSLCAIATWIQDSSFLRSELRYHYQEEEAMKKGLLVPAAIVMTFLTLGWLNNALAQTVLKAFPLDSLDNLISRDGASFDKEDSADGKGSLKIVAENPRVVNLFEVGGLDLDNARLIYRAKLKTQDLKGKAYLEMWCTFPGKGSFFSRGLTDPLSGTNGWSTREIPFFLKTGEKPELVRLNLVIDGGGTVWIDDIKLLKGPLQ